MLPPRSPLIAGSELDGFLSDYREARRRERQWRIPQSLTALFAPVTAFVSVLLLMAGMTAQAMAIGGLAVVLGFAAAVFAIEVWRWNRKAVGIFDHLSRDARDTRRLMLEPLQPGSE